MVGGLMRSPAYFKALCCRRAGTMVCSCQCMLRNWIFHPTIPTFNDLQCKSVLRCLYFEELSGTAKDHRIEIHPTSLTNINTDRLVNGSSGMLFCSGSPSLTLVLRANVTLLRSKLFAQREEVLGSIRGIEGAHFPGLAWLVKAARFG